MAEFITEIRHQTVCIDGTVYSSEDIKDLHEKFCRTYGQDSFHASLAMFLAEWFNDSPTLKVHTSGSTGVPKELWVEKQRMMNSAMMTVSFLGLQTGDNALLCMPLRYIAGKMVVVRSLVAGLNIIPVAPGGHPMQNIDTPPEFAAMIPMQVFNSLQTAPERNRLMQVKHLIIGGGAINRELSDELRSFPHAVWSTYGMTETLSHIALRRLNGSTASEWYTPFDNVRISLSAENTLQIEAPSVSPEKLFTNDIAEFNGQGQFRILGRKDNIINTGGVKVQAEQVEALLSTCLNEPFIITSVPDIKFGERIVLLLESPVTSNASLPEKAFDALPPYWRPKQTLFVKHLPLTETGKPDRPAARRMARSLLAE